MTKPVDALPNGLGIGWLSRGNRSGGQDFPCRQVNGTMACSGEGGSTVHWTNWGGITLTMEEGDVGDHG